MKAPHHWPEAVDLHAPAAWWCIDFISDVHLCAQLPHTFEAWRAYLLHTPASAVFILGDLFDAWVGDDARHEGFEADAARVLTAAAARRPLWFMAGNRDFLLGPDMLQSCGVHRVNDPTVLSAFGQRALLTHGDQLCVNDVEYQRFRLQVHDSTWQTHILSRPLSERRALARDLRAGSAAHQSAAHGMLTDADPAAALAWLSQARTDVLVHGHTHRPASHTMAPGRVRHVLSDWDLDHGASAARSEVMRWSETGWARLSPTQALNPHVR